MDWDSHRYLEAYFAIPMIGCVLQTANVRLSPEQLLYTLNHAGASIILVNAEFLPLLESLYDKLESAKTFILIDEPASKRTVRSRLPASTSNCWHKASATTHSRISTRTRARRRSTPRHDRSAERRLLQPSPDRAEHLGNARHLRHQRSAGTDSQRRRLYADHAAVPRTRWGMPYAATLLGIKQVYPGRYVPDMLIKLIRDEAVTFTHGVPTVLHMLMNCPQAAQTDLSK